MKYLISIIVLNITMFMIELKLGLTLDTFVTLGAINHNEWLRIVSYGFIHISVAHITSNLIFTSILWVILKKRLESKYIALIYMLGITLSGVVIMMYGNPYIVTLGASAGWYALLGASLVIKLDNKLKASLIIITMWCLVHTFTTSGTSVLGHTTALIVGLTISLIGVIVNVKRKNGNTTKQYDVISEMA